MSSLLKDCLEVAFKYFQVGNFGLLKFRVFILFLGVFFKHFLGMTEQEYYRVITYFLVEGNFFAL